MVLSAKSSKTQFSFSSLDAPLPAAFFPYGGRCARDGMRTGYVTGMQASVPWTHGMCVHMWFLSRDYAGCMRGVLEGAGYETALTETPSLP